MKKHFQLIMVALIVMGILFSCSKENDMIDVSNSKGTTLTAYIEQETLSRILLGETIDGITKVLWSKEDAFALVDGEKRYIFTRSDKNECDADKAQFTYMGDAELPAITTEGLKFIYPAEAPTDDQSGILEDLYQHLVIEATIPEGITSYNNLKLSFKHKSAILKLTLYNDDFKGKDVTNVTLNANGTMVVTSTVTYQGASDGHIEAYFSVKPEELRDVKLIATCDGQDYMVALDDNILVAGTIYNVTKTLTKVNIPYITFKASKPGQTLVIKTSGSEFKLDKSFQYSVDGGAWLKLSLNSPIVLGGEETSSLRIRAMSNSGTVIGNSDICAYFSFLDGGVYVDCTGDIRTLVDYSNYNNANTSNARFGWLFMECTVLTSAPTLPATVLANNCYHMMFSGCTSLKVAPELPATTLAEACYYNMFSGCIELEEAPTSLPATTLTTNCYSQMFTGCYSLRDIPALPAETLAEGCYQFMFKDCEQLTAAPELPATTLAKNCYAGMFYGCKYLNPAPALPATTLAETCYLSMFYDCLCLTESPVLPATTLAKGCYLSMFRNCINLNKVTMLVDSKEAVEKAETAFNYWLDGTAIYSGQEYKLIIAPGMKNILPFHIKKTSNSNNMNGYINMPNENWIIEEQIFIEN